MIVVVSGLGAKEAKRATGTIPIVIVADPDPVGNGLVESLARPGGNVTGLSLMIPDLSGKRFALFKKIVPKLARVAVVLDPRDPFLSLPASLTKELRKLGVFDPNIRCHDI